MDLCDFGHYQNCFTGPAAEDGSGTPLTCDSGCDVFDLAPDNALDLADLAILGDILNGP